MPGFRKKFTLLKAPKRNPLYLRPKFVPLKNQEEPIILRSVQGNFSRPEMMVYKWLEDNEAAYGIVWYAQVPLGAAGARVDVAITEPIRAFGRVQGLYYHLANPQAIALDLIQKIALESSSKQPVIDLWESDIYQNVDSVMRDFLRGVQRPQPETFYIPNKPRW